LIIRPEGENIAHFCVATIDNCIELNNSNVPPFVTSQNRFEIREHIADEEYMSAASLSELERRLGTTVRTIRDTEQSRWVKRLYDYRCQICGITIPVPRDFPSDGYCEGHHVRPLNIQHNGPDHSSNILALCPNHHAMMDLGVIAVDPTTLEILTIVPNEPSRDYIMTLKKEHQFDPRFLYYHLEHIYIANH
jgi:predicted restriction endonuclease